MVDPQVFAPLAAGFVLGASLIVAIGAQNAFVLRQGLRREHVGAVVAACAAIDSLLIAAGVAGLGAALGPHPALLRALSWLGAAVLAAYGVQAARRALHPGTLQAQGEAPATRRAVLMQAASLSLLNPHVYLDTVLLVGSVGAQQQGAARPLFALGAAAASFTWFMLLGYGARAAAPLFSRALAWRLLDAGVALTMWTLAVLLATGRLGG
jgi:L-lysine exporter family protein LysE/ArgO